MLTIPKNQAVSVRVRLNPDKLAGESITITLDSPSRESIEFASTITNISNSLYTFDLTALQTDELIDDTYNYTISQGEEELKKGDVNTVL